MVGISNLCLDGVVRYMHIYEAKGLSMQHGEEKERCHRRRFWLDWSLKYAMTTIEK